MRKKVIEDLIFIKDKLITNLPNLQKSLSYAISSLKTDEAYQLEYENREVKEIVHAKWIHLSETDRFKEQWVCSNCNHGIIENPKFTNWITGESLDFVWCPMCGAKMDKGDIDDSETT